ncbi:ribonuclease E/G [Yunchengibacter salinarum]|uniref:ribonuclease E/G n=1 Tax=Yunchengibacter salinarum TaxID=3133399 RepID=UPI0035B66C1A
MTDRLLIEPGIGQWRSAHLGEDDLPLDVHFHDDPALGPALGPVDAVMDGVVRRVDGALDMLFLDLGAGRTGVMNFRRARLMARDARAVADCAREGDRLRVQVVAEPGERFDKGFPVTPRPKLAGRYVVVESGKGRLNFSKDISPKMQAALSDRLAPLATSAAVVVRGRAENVAADHVVAEAERLVGALQGAPGEPGLRFAWTPAEQALLVADDGDGAILVDGGPAHRELLALARRHWPDLVPRIVRHDGAEPAFETFGVDEAIDEALAERIDLPSGGWIGIEETRALTTVDVNMGAALASLSPAEAKRQVNMEAALAVAFHLRFQDIGGLVVVDFIDCSKAVTQAVITVLDRALRDDPVPVHHGGISPFGLMEFSRKRRGRSLRQRMLSPGIPRPAPDMQVLDLLRRAARLGRDKAPGTLVLTLPQAAARWLEAHPALLDGLGQETHRQVRLETGRAVDVALLPDR